MAHCYSSVVTCLHKMVDRWWTPSVNDVFGCWREVNETNTVLHVSNWFVMRQSKKKISTVCSCENRDLASTLFFPFRVDSFQLNRTTYQRVRDWFDGVDAYRRTLISRQLEEYPSCDDLVEGSGKNLRHRYLFWMTFQIADGPAWAWIMLNVLPIEPDLQYSVLISQSFRSRLQVINGTIDFLLEYQQRHDQQLQQQQQQDLEREEEHEREHEQTPEEPIPLASEWLRVAF